MAWLGVVAVGIGASVGAWLRWTLSMVLNPVFPTVPLGTLASNLIGGYLVGVAIGFFNQYPGFAPELRLLLVTGFLGGLTTFSTFSGEIVTLIGREQYGWALGATAAHLFGSLSLTALGLLTVKWFVGG
jgi:fluoride exporter